MDKGDYVKVSDLAVEFRKLSEFVFSRLGMCGNGLEICAKLDRILDNISKLDLDLKGGKKQYEDLVYKLKEGDSCPFKSEQYDDGRFACNFEGTGDWAYDCSKCSFDRITITRVGG